MLSLSKIPKKIVPLLADREPVYMLYNARMFFCFFLGGGGGVKKNSSSLKLLFKLHKKKHQQKYGFSNSKFLSDKSGSMF